VMLVPLLPLTAATPVSIMHSVACVLLVDLTKIVMLGLVPSALWEDLVKGNVLNLGVLIRTPAIGLFLAVKMLGLGMLTVLSV
jgi:hypothetical protein